MTRLSGSYTVNGRASAVGAELASPSLHHQVRQAPLAAVGPGIRDAAVGSVHRTAQRSVRRLARAPYSAPFGGRTRALGLSRG